MSAGGYSIREARKREVARPAMNAAMTTFSSSPSTRSVCRLKRVTYSLRGSPFCCFTWRREAADFRCLCPPTKWLTNILLSCSKDPMDSGLTLENHILAAPLKVVGKARHITSSGI
ncbi:hypothetical protein U1Q18_052585 [Sarracenia purpurea var. burkii]